MWLTVNNVEHWQSMLTAHIVSEWLEQGSRNLCWCSIRFLPDNRDAGVVEKCFIFVSWSHHIFENDASYNRGSNQIKSN